MKTERLDAETIEILSKPKNNADQWALKESDETLSFRDHLRKLNIADNDINNVVREATAVVSRCTPPTASSSAKTGLVIGYVQSGKTMSFTAVTALARDNGYKLIIVISGVNTNLFQQSTDRLKSDLRLNERNDRKWQFLFNPKSKPEVRQRISVAFGSHAAMPGIGNQTVLITVMKNHAHLKHLINLLQGIKLEGVPTLLIDDEADQASLNNLVKRGKESTIYKLIKELRQGLPHHTFLQYTATPQAVLLINLIDILSPDFAELLTPGPAYTGGKTFFEREFRLVTAIPAKDIPTKKQTLLEPPKSLLEAMQFFFVGVAVGLKEEEGARKHRSMMVHPAKETVKHADYFHWVEQIRLRWESTLNLGELDPDRIELVNEFKQAHAELGATIPDIPTLADLLPYLISAVTATIVIETNSAKGKTPQVDWHQNYAHILVGGDVLNRGYTLEGLTVTYMPRNKGVGNADTIEQRARWFGYKADYLGFCRVYLGDETLTAYKAYVTHEEDIRQQLREHVASGKSLREWRRAFFLSAELRPTRSNVIDGDYVRGNYSDTWYQPKAPHDSANAVEFNRKLVHQLRTKYIFHPDKGHPERTKYQLHLVAENLSLQDIYSEFLTRLRATSPKDSQPLIGLLLQLGKHLRQYPTEICTVYFMGGNRIRGTDENDELSRLFEGAHPDMPSERPGEIYPGDRNIKSLHGVTIQTHMLQVTKNKQPFMENVPAIAIWVPKVMAEAWLVQDQSESIE